MTLAEEVELGEQSGAASEKAPTEHPVGEWRAVPGQSTIPDVMQPMGRCE